jgi:heterodisulfide reductase subunit A
MPGSKNQKKVLVIGGGITGLTAGQELARLGIEVLLVEKAPFAGGHAVHLACKATDRCLHCNDCLVEERLREIAENPDFEVLLRTEVQKVERNGKTYLVSVRSEPTLIDPRKCTDCGICFEKCPDASVGAILTAPSHHLHPRFAIEPSVCRYFRGEGENVCESSCPEGAINLDAPETSREVEVDALVVATGYQPFDPREQPRFNFTRFKNMVTATEIEKLLRLQGDILRPSDGRPPETMAFIQCVGSRDSRLNRDYCSRVCCGYALRMALRVGHQHPDLRITVFYMDIQSFGKDFERYYEEARSRVRLIRGLPGDFYVSEKERISINYYDDESRKTVFQDFDMVVLSVGMGPSPSGDFFRNALGASLNEEGFLDIPEELENAGIVIAGSAQGPMDVSESIAHARSASLELARFLGVIGQSA